MRYLLISILLFVISSCKNGFFYTDLYVRKTSSLKHIQKHYESDYKIKVAGLHFCLLENPSGIVRKSVGSLTITHSQIVDNLITSYGNRFEDFAFNEKSIDISNAQCRWQNKESIIQSIKDDPKNCESQIELYAQLKLVIESQRNLDGGGGLELTEDLGNDKHVMEYFLITALSKDGSLIYMDNIIHWTEVFYDRGEIIQYNIPQETIDSLVTLSLEQYFERVR